MNDLKPSVEWLAISCFLNSLLREWHDWQKLELPQVRQVRSACRDGLRLNLEQNPEYRAIWIPLRRYSIVGRHRFESPLYREDRDGRIEALGLMQLADLILGEPSIVGMIGEAQRKTFLQRLQDSWGMTAEALELRKDDMETAFFRELSFQQAEQMLLVGHSFHPTPKSRDEFTPTDKQLYSPEMAGHFPLSWVVADPRYVLERRSEHFQQDWIGQLMASDPSLEIKVPAGFRVLPMHPWQAEKLKQHPALQNALANESIQFVSPGGKDWFPTSSLRSLYRQEAPYMLKFSLSLKLTNSVRHLLVPEVERGVQVYDVLRSDHGQQLLRNQPTLHIIGEPAYAMLVGDNGELLHESIVVCRENPFQASAQSEPLVLATLTQDDPLGRGNLILQHVKALAQDERIPLADAARSWFKTFCQVALEPLLDAQSNFGILLGAHQQNMLITLKGHRPDRLYFRDCQGTGYSDWAYQRMRNQVPTLDLQNGNIVSDEMGVYLFTYYLVINTTFNVIAAIADSAAIGERELLADFRQVLMDMLAHQPFDDRLLRDLLYKDTLMNKGNFRCSVQGINENTSKNPMAIYAPMDNPLRFLPTLKDRDMNANHTPVNYQAPGVPYAVSISSQGRTIDVFLRGQRVMEFNYEGGRMRMVQDYQGPERERIHLHVMEFVLSHEPSRDELDCTELQAPFSDATSERFLERHESRVILDREAFFQYAALWHRHQAEACSPERWISTQGRKHPKRPPVAPGLLYRRHVASLGCTLSFELFDLDQHLDVFHDWHNQPRVSQFWELAHSKEKLAEYIQKMALDPHQIPVIARLDGRPIGYFEIYWTPEDRLGPYYDYDPFDRGFHFLIGEAKALGRKGTPQFIQSMVHFIFLDDPRTRRVMGEPRHDNIKLLRYLQTIPGWVKVKEFDFPHKRAALLQIRREDFFAPGGFL